MKKIIVAMSGGVDSSVAALLLQQQGFHIEGMFMKNWEEDDTEEFCSATQDIKDAQSVCDRLGIKLHKVNFAHEYWENVFEHFLEEYKNGRTPNPDIWCNKEIKFKAFLDFALSLGADAIATGHYARVKNNNGEYQLLCGLDNSKDQSYFLYTLQQHQLAKALFPIGELHKSEVRKIAEENHFVTHDKKDSTGICFIGERRFKDFLQKYIANKPGEIKTCEGKVIGTHDGLMYYTIGQRQGLKIGGMKSAEEKPWYVIDKDLANNILIVGQGHDHPKLFQQKLICNDLHWVAGSLPDLSKKYSAKIRYRTSAHSCNMNVLDESQLEVIFDEKQWAITPGQSIVFYDDEICLGGGIIS